MAKHKHVAVIPWAKEHLRRHRDLNSSVSGGPISNSNSNIYRNNRATDNELIDSAISESIDELIDDPIIDSNNNINDSNIYEYNHVTQVINNNSNNIAKLVNNKTAKKKRLPRRKANDPTIRVGDMVRLRMPTLIEVCDFANVFSNCEWSSQHELIVNRNQPVRVVFITSTIIQIFYYNTFMNIKLYYPLCCATRIIKNSATINKNEEVNVIADEERCIKL
jgi:hypothetical protein